MRAASSHARARPPVRPLRTRVSARPGPRLPPAASAETRGLAPGDRDTAIFRVRHLVFGRDHQFAVAAAQYLQPFDRDAAPRQAPRPRPVRAAATGRGCRRGCPPCRPNRRRSSRSDCRRGRARRRCRAPPADPWLRGAPGLEIDLQSLGRFVVLRQSRAGGQPETRKDAARSVWICMVSPNLVERTFMRLSHANGPILTSHAGRGRKVSRFAGQKFRRSCRA
jgi:hypothetical protein